MNQNQHTQNRQDLINAWKIAEYELGIRVESPFRFTLGTFSYDCITYLPDFGGKHGMLIGAIFPPHFELDDQLNAHAKTVGLYVSFISSEVYSAFDSTTFIEALTDWGFFGPIERRPTWLGVK